MLPSFAKQTVTVLRPSYVEDERGNLVPGEYQSHSVPRCLLQPGASTEFTDGRDTVAITATLYLPPGADIQPGDRVKIDALTYEVDGEPQRWESPTGRVSHTVAFLKTWKG